VTARRKLGVTALCFALALGLVAAAAATRSSAPLFAAWVPLLVVPWALSRPEPGRDRPEPGPDRGSPAEPGAPGPS
jgi:hypothetical protein